MKRYIQVGLCMMLGLCGLASCEKELMDYEGTDALYFDVQYQHIRSLNDCDEFDHRFVQLRHPQSRDA